MGLDQLASDHIQNAQCIRDNNCKKQYTGDTGGRGDRINKFAARAAVCFSRRPQCGRWRHEAPPAKGILLSCPKAALITPNERKTPCSGAGRKNAGVLLWKSLFVYFFRQSANSAQGSKPTSPHPKPYGPPHPACIYPNPLRLHG